MGGQRPETITGFDDAMSPQVYSIPIAPVSSLLVKPDLVAVKEYLARPYLAFTTTWTAAGAGSGTMYPFSYLGSNTNWIEKLKHYTDFRGDARVRVVCNGTPYHYGRFCFSYMPFGPIRGARLGRTNAEYATYVSMMQLPTVLIDPSCDTPVEFVVPFCAYDSTIHLQGAAGTLSDIATLSYYPISALSMSNSATASNVTLSVYVSYENVHLSGTTPNTTITTSGSAGGKLTEQLRSGPVSKIATAVAGAADKLKDIPFIGPFARATEIGASAVSAIAGLFGFSKPLVIVDHTVVVQKPGGDLATGVGRDLAIPLVLDPMREMTVDPRVAHGPPYDEMTFKFFKSRFGYLGKFTWADTRASGYSLAAWMVHPMILSDVATAYRHFMPVGHLASMYKYWRGSMIYRLTVIASPLMKGRLSVRHIPYGTTTATATGFGNVDTKACILDLTERMTIDIEVPWAQTEAWKPCQYGFFLNNGAAGPGVLCTDVNGYLQIEVVSPLVTNYAGASVEILVHARGGDDIVFLDPCATLVGAGATLSILTAGMAGDSLMSHLQKDVMVCTVGVENQGVPLNLYQVFGGDHTESIRVLLKKYSQSGFDTLALDNAAARYPYVVKVSPPLLTNTGGTVGNFPDIRTPFAWFGPCFRGCRGGGRWKVLLGFEGTEHQVNGIWGATRIPAGNAAFSGTQGNAIEQVVGTGELLGYELTPTNSLAAAHTAYATSINALEFEIPDYNPRLFRTHNANVAGASDALCIQSGIFQGVAIQLPNYPSTFDAESLTVSFWSSVAEDFSFVGFVSTPLVKFWV